MDQSCVASGFEKTEMHVVVILPDQIRTRYV